MADEPEVPLGAYLRLLVLEPDQVPEQARDRIARGLAGCVRPDLDDEGVALLEVALGDPASGLGERLGEAQVVRLRAILDRATGRQTGLLSPLPAGLPGWLRVEPPSPAPELEVAGTGRVLGVLAFVLGLGGLALLLPGGRPVVGPVRPLAEARREATAPPEEPLPSVAPTAPPVLPVASTLRPWATSDSGQRLPLDSLEVRVARLGPVSMVELEMVLRNAGDSPVEARLDFPLPEGAGLARAARWLGERREEGEVVDAASASGYPLESSAPVGNLVRLRAYPLAPGARARLVLAWTSTTPATPEGRRALRVPLGGLGQAGRFRFRSVTRLLPGEEHEVPAWLRETAGIRRTGDRVVVEDLEDRVGLGLPDELILEVRRGDATPESLLLTDTERALLVQHIPVRPDRPQGREPSWVFVVDGSASGREGGARRLEALAKVQWAAPPSGKLLVTTTFDRDVHTDETPAFAGGTDLRRALVEVLQDARVSELPRVYVLVTDGLVTLGPDGLPELLDGFEAWPERHTLHVLVLGAREDVRVTEALALAGRGRVVRVPLDGDLAVPAAAAAREMRRPRDAEVHLEVVSPWSEQGRMPGVREGGELTAWMRLASPQVPLMTWRRGRDFPIRMSPTVLVAGDFAPLLRREAARAELAELARREAETLDREERLRLARDQRALSLEHRIPGRHATMLLLGSEADYRRHGLVRHRLPEVLAVGDRGVVDALRPARLPPLGREFSQGEALRGNPRAGWIPVDRRGLPAPYRRFLAPDEPTPRAAASPHRTGPAGVWARARDESPDDRVLRELQEAVEAAPRDPVAPLGLLHAYQRLATRRAARAPDPRDPVRLGLEARLERAAGRWAEAHPTSPLVDEFRARAALRAGNPAAAARWASSLLDLDPWSPRARLRAGYLLLAAGDVTGARAVFQRLGDEAGLRLTDPRRGPPPEETTLRVVMPPAGLLLLAVDPDGQECSAGTPRTARGVEHRFEGGASVIRAPAGVPLEVGVQLPEDPTGPTLGVLVIEGPRGLRVLPFALPAEDPAGTGTDRWLASVGHTRPDE